jgi:hypothetical protein
MTEELEQVFKTMDVSQSEEVDWRELFTSLREQKLYMLEHGIHSDCTFVVGPEDGDTQEFKAHRLLLTMASAVFEKMLMGEMSEAVTGHVRIIDILPRTFQLLLK